MFKDFKIDHGFHLCILNSITSSISKKKVNRDFSSFRALHISMPNYNMMIKLYLTTFGFIHSTLNVNIEKFFHLYYDYINFFIYCSVKNIHHIRVYFPLSRGFDPLTFRLTVECSNQLSYESQKLLPRFELRLLDSKSSVITATL